MTEEDGLMGLIPANNQFAAEMDHFSDCILTNKRPYSTGEDGLQDHRIMEAIYQSAKVGKPVKLTDKPRSEKPAGPGAENGLAFPFEENHLIRVFKTDA